MSGGFNNPIIGGGGALVYPSIHAPNYVPGSTGWTVNKDGSVEFNNGTFRGTVSAATIIASIIKSASLAPGYQIDASGDIIIYNSFGAIVLYIAPSKDGVFVYADTGSATQGALIASMTGTSGTDPVNATTYNTGTNTYVTIAGQTYAVGLNQSASGIITGAGLAINSLTNPAFSPGGIFGQVNHSGTPQALVQVTSGAETNTDAFAALALQSGAGSAIPGGYAKIAAALFEVNASLQLDGPAVPKAQMTSANALQFFPDPTSVTPARYSDGGNGDGNTYAVGQLTQSLHGTQNIVSTTPVVITNMSFNVAVGVRYVLDMMLTWVGVGTTGTAVFGFDGSSTTTQQSVFFWTGTGSPTDGTGTGGNIASPTLTTTRQGLIYKALLVCTVAGVFNIRAQTSAGGSNYTMNDSYATLTPT